MSTPTSIYEAYLFPGSPFYLPIDEQTIVTIGVVAQTERLEIAIARELLTRCLGEHYLYLHRHPEVLTSFSTTSTDLVRYFQGVVAPLEVIIAASLHIQGKQQEADLGLSRYQQEDNGMFIAFMKSKIDQCMTLLLKKGHTDKSWEDIFRLGYGYDSSNYYRVGINVAEISFMSCKEAVLNTPELAQMLKNQSTTTASGGGH